MTYTFTFSGRDSVLTSDIYPPIELDDNSQYVLGFINFESYNAIPNIDEKNCNFYFDNSIIKIPTGAYGVRDISKYLRKQVEQLNKQNMLIIKANKNTLKCEIKATKNIDFNRSDTFGDILGFKKQIMAANTLYTSEHPVNIFKVNAICIECDLVGGSFKNNEQVHIIHQFFPNAEPGEKIVEAPGNIIYLPINTRIISSITIKILDQNGELVNFRGEAITLRLHLKKR